MLDIIGLAFLDTSVVSGKRASHANRTRTESFKKEARPSYRLDYQQLFFYEPALTPEITAVSSRGGYPNWSERRKSSLEGS